MIFSLSKSNSMSSALSQHSIYYACVTIMSFLVAFENLAIVSSYDEIKALVSLLELFCDFLLFIVYLFVQQKKPLNQRLFLFRHEKGDRPMRTVAFVNCCEACLRRES